MLNVLLSENIDLFCKLFALEKISALQVKDLFLGFQRWNSVSMACF